MSALSNLVVIQALSFCMRILGPIRLSNGQVREWGAELLIDIGQVTVRE